MGWLNTIVLHAHQQNPHALLVRSTGRPILNTEAVTLVGAAKEARNAVAHHRYMSNERFVNDQSKLLRLLEVLQFDVANAIDRIEALRSSLVLDILKDLRRSKK
jgi:hypothetical protein